MKEYKVEIITNNDYGSVTALLDIVFFDQDISVDSVRKSLIEHDGYPQDIIICDADKAKIEGWFGAYGFCEHCGKIIDTERDVFYYGQFNKCEECELFLRQRRH